MFLNIVSFVLTYFRIRWIIVPPFKFNNHHRFIIVNSVVGVAYNYSVFIAGYAKKVINMHCIAPFCYMF